MTTAPLAPASVASCDLSPYHSDRIAVWSDYRLKDSVKRVPGARWDAENRCWTVPLSWPSCLALRTELGKNLTIGDGLNAWAKEERASKDAVKALSGAHVLDDIELPFDDPSFDGMYPHQKTGAACLLETGRFAFFDEMGTGKGRTTLAGLKLMVAASQWDEVFPALIVAPKSMLPTWARDEIPRFFPTATVTVVSGTPSKVKAALEAKANIYVCTYDTARRYSRHAPYPPIVTLTEEEKTEKELNAIDFKSVIVDEAQAIKNPSSKQTRALWWLGHHAENRVVLTGTPIQDTPEDLWPILHFLSPLEYPGKTAYVERFLQVGYNEWGGREITGLNPLNEIEFRANAETRFRRVTKAMALPHLPPKVFETRWVELSPKMRKAYDSMVDVLVAEMESGDRLVAQSNLDRAGRLIQIANSSGTVTEEEVTDDDGVTTVKKIFKMALPSPKIDAFMEDIANGDYDGQQVVVFSDSRQLIDLLDEEMTRKKVDHVMVTGGITGDDRQRAIDAFQKDGVQFILITRAGGTGLTLTAASTMVRLVRAWSYIVHSQSEDRVHRIGSEIHESITYIDYITQDTVEEGQLARLHGKKERATEVLRDDELLDMIRRK